MRTLALVAALAPLAAQSQPSRSPLERGAYAITNVNVVAMTRDTVIRNATVIVRDGRVAAIQSSATRVPAGLREINATGKYLIPGLADVHTHLYADSELPDSLAKYEAGVILSYGITAARLMIGAPHQIGLRKDVQEGRVLGPQLWLASPHITGRPDVNAYVATTPEQAKAAVKQGAAAGYDFIKITNNISQPVFDAAIEEARAQRIRIDGHIDPVYGVAHALASGQAGIQHLDGYFEAALADSAPSRVSLTQGGVFPARNWPSIDHIDHAKMAKLAGMTARSGVWSTPTLVVFNTAFAIGQPDSVIRSRPEWAFMPQRLKDGYLRSNEAYWRPVNAQLRTEERRKKYVWFRNAMAKAIADSGGKLLVGSDSPDWFLGYGATVHRELEAFVAAGLTPYQALAAATRNPAEYFGALTEWGTIETGKRADFVLLSGNPLEDVRNTTRIDAVAIGGRWLTRADLDGLMRVATERVGAAAAAAKTP